MKIPPYASLRTRLLLVLLALTLLPALLIGGLAYRNARHTVVERVISQLTSVADLKEEQITTWLHTTAGDARLIADNFLNEEHFTEILDPRTEPQRRTDFANFLIDNLISVQQARPGYSEIMMVDASGRIILSTDRDHIGLTSADYPAVAQTFASPTGEFIGDIHQARDTGDMEMAFGHVLYQIDLDTFEETPTVNGVVIIRVRMDDTIYPLLRAWPGMGETGETLLARADDDAILFLNPLRFDENAALNLRIPIDSPNAKPAYLATAENEGIITTPDYRGVPVLAAYRHIPEIHWGIVAKEDVAEAFEPVTALTRQWIIITTLVLLAAIAAAVLLGRALTQPLAQLVKASRSMAAGDLDTELDIQRHDEIGVLAHSFQAMIAAVRASHAELQAHGEEVEALFSLSQTLLATLDIATTLEHALREAISGTNCTAGAVLLTNPGRSDMTVQAVVDLPQNIVGQSLPIDAHSAPGYALKQREAILTSDLERETRFGVPPFIHDLDVRALLAVPMILDGKALGAFVLDAFEPHEFTEDEIWVAQAVANQTAIAIERARLFQDLSESYDRTLDALAAALDARDNETEGHSRRVVAYTLALACEMGLPKGELASIRRGALLHDIGKIGVPDAILHKPGALTEEEWAIMRRHPEWGESILRGIQFLEEPAQMVRTHHERWDGSGYPAGLQGESIPLGARIFAVADTFDAITSDRPYRAAQTYDKARKEIESHSGTQFDPKVVQAFLRLPKHEWARLRTESQTSEAAENQLAQPEKGATLAMQPELASFQELIAAVHNSLELDRVLQEGARAAVDTLGAAASGLFIYDSEIDDLRLVADVGFPAALKANFAKISVSGSHDELVVRTGRPMLYGSIDEIEAFVEIGLPDLEPDWGQYLCVPLSAHDQVEGMMCIFSNQQATFEAKDLALYKASGEIIGRAIANARLHASVQHQAFTDSLTETYNRRYMDQFLRQELERCARYEHGVSLLILDIDNFKQYNDSYGHVVGDEALRELAHVLRQYVRTVDLVARYGGEEFAIVLPETNQEGAYTVAEKLRAIIANHEFTHGQLTVSIGVAHCKSAEATDLSPETFIMNADRALYAAKESRNTVRVS